MDQLKKRLKLINLIVFWKSFIIKIKNLVESKIDQFALLSIVLYYLTIKIIIIVNLSYIYRYLIPIIFSSKTRSPVCIYRKNSKMEGKSWDICWSERNRSLIIDRYYILANAMDRHRYTLKVNWSLIRFYFHSSVDQTAIFHLRIEIVHFLFGCFRMNLRSNETKRWNIVVWIIFIFFFFFPYRKQSLRFNRDLKDLSIFKVWIAIFFNVKHFYGNSERYYKIISYLKC